jgi:uncharacterized protein
VADERKSILEAARAFVKSELERDSSGHDWWHIVRVIRTAKLLAAIERADEFVCELAALLHDIADEKLNESKEAGLRKVSNWLEQAGVKPSDREHIMDIVETMSFGGGHGQPMPTLEGQIVQDSDRLDAIGAIGIARTFAYSGWKGQLIYDPELRPRDNLTKEAYRSGQTTAINHFYEKLLKLKSLMNTKAARVLAEERQQFMKFFLSQFDREWELGNESYIEEMLPSEDTVTRVHVAFGESAAGSLRFALRGLPGEKTVCLSDDLMIGPLSKADDPEGDSRRLQWILDRMDRSSDKEEIMGSLLKVSVAWRNWPPRLIGFPVIVWAGDSAAEQTALRRLLAALPEETVVSVVNATSLLSRVTDKHGYRNIYRSTGEITPDKLRPLANKAEPLSPERREALIADWHRLVAENGVMRVLEDGELKTVPEDYYDGTIIRAARKLKAVNGRYIMAARLVGEVIGHMEQRVGDSFIEFRVRQLVECGIMSYKGDIGAMRSYSVCLTEAAR